MTAREQAATLASWVRYYPSIFGDEAPASVVRSWRLTGHDSHAIGQWLDTVERAAVDAGAVRLADVRVCHRITLALFAREAAK